MVIQESPVARDRTCVLREGQARRQREVLVVLHRDVEVVLVERYPARQPVRPVSQAFHHAVTGGQSHLQLREGAVDVEARASSRVLDDHEHLPLPVLELEPFDGRERRERTGCVRVRA